MRKFLLEPEYFSELTPISKKLNDSSISVLKNALSTKTVKLNFRSLGQKSLPIDPCFNCNPSILNRDPWNFLESEDELTDFP